MKYKHSVILAAVVLGLSGTLFAVEKQTETSAPKLIRLRSNGDTIAELSIPKDTKFEITAKELNYDVNSQQQTAKGDVTIRIMHAGNSPVVVKADEIEAVSVAALATNISNDTSKVIRLKAQGETIAEVRLLKITSIKFTGKPTLTDNHTGRMTSRCDTLEIPAGTKTITIKAEEIEFDGTLK